MAGPGQPSLFARRLRQARERAALTQYELGLRAGLDASVAAPRINQYENGVHEPRQQTAKQIADALGIPPAFFYSGDDDLARLLLAWPSLTKDKRRKLADLVAGKPEVPPTAPVAKNRSRRKP